MIINVTQEHIDNGRRTDCTRCALALALRDAGFPKSMVSCSHIWPYGIKNESVLKSVKMPSQVYTFREYFDDGLPVEPFSFELELPA